MGGNEAYRAVLTRLGWVSIAVGTVDIGLMAYCISHHISYSSSLNVFAVAGGVLFLRGSLATVRQATRLLAFMLAGLTGALLFVFPSQMPIDLLFTKLRIDPLGSLLSALWGLIGLTFILWAYLQLRHPTVVEATIAAGQSGSPPKRAFVAGALLSVALAALFAYTQHSDAAVRALRLAEAKEGPAFKYSVSSLNWSGDHGRALVTAYNDREIKSVDVEW